MTDCQAIASAEVRKAGVPYFINWIGLGMAVPTLLECERSPRERFLPPIFPVKTYGARVLVNPALDPI